MIKATERTKILKTLKTISDAKRQLKAAEDAYNSLRLAALRTVTTSKKGDTVTLTAGNTVYKAKKPPRYTDRWNVTKDGKKVATEFLGGIHDVRFAIAMGMIK